jgi:hypothetical protein
MHPVARALQILLLIAGFAMLWVGFVVEDESDDQRRFALKWSCGPESGGGNKQRCETVFEGDNDNYSYNNGADSVGLTASLAGVGLIAASVSVAVGGARRSAPAGGHAGGGTYTQAPPQMPGQAPQPPRY